MQPSAAVYEVAPAPGGATKIGFQKTKLAVNGGRGRQRRANVRSQSVATVPSVDDAVKNLLLPISVFGCIKQSGYAIKRGSMR
jgi:hypothetical protein